MQMIEKKYFEKKDEKCLVEKFLCANGQLAVDEMNMFVPSLSRWDFYVPSFPRWCELE
jgi:hypothetical protein